MLITGAAGLVGTRAVHRFVREGMTVRAVDRRSVDLPRAEFIMSDVCDPLAMERATTGVALIVHCAAVIAGAADELTRVNVEGTRVLVDAAMRAECERFLYISTAAVYELDGLAVVDESTPLRQEGPPFHLSRVRAEQVVWAASARGLNVTVFRPHFILGAHPTATWSTLLAERMLKGDFTLPGDGSGSWPYVHVDNLVDAVLAAAYTPEAIGQAYNIVDGHTTAREYTDLFRCWLGLDSLPSRGDAEPWHGRLSGAKAERDLRYTARVSYEEALAETERYLSQIGMITR
jgi:nucleoside-diphosphate-sugar epimerase